MDSQINIQSQPCTWQTSVVVTRTFICTWRLSWIQYTDRLLYARPLSLVCDVLYPVSDTLYSNTPSQPNPSLTFLLNPQRLAALIDRSHCPPLSRDSQSNYLSAAAPPDTDSVTMATFQVKIPLNFWQITLDAIVVAFDTGTPGKGVEGYGGVWGPPGRHGPGGMSLEDPDR